MPRPTKHRAFLEALRQELLSTGGASANITHMPMSADEWRSDARRIARAEGRTVRTFRSGDTVHATLTDYPANEVEEASFAAALRRGVERIPAVE